MFVIGVYTTEVDSMRHKVTVTGNVEAETLIKKLSRSGKSVELLPQKPPEKKDKKPSTKSKEEINEDQNNSTEPVDESGHEDCIVDVADDGGEEDSNHNDSGDGDGDGDGGGDNKSEGGAKKKKKKKKKNKSGAVTSVPLHNNDGGEKVIISTEKVDTPKEIIVPPVLEQQHGYGYGHNNPYPPHMYYSHPPIGHAPPPYGLSYNTSYPVNSTSGYYVGAPIMPMHANYARFPPPSDPVNNYGYHHEHDEYEGGYCSIM